MRYNPHPRAPLTARGRPPGASQGPRGRHPLPWGGGSLLEHFINSRSVFHLKITWFSYPLVFFLRPISHCLLSRKRKKPRNSQVFPFLTYILNCLGQAASSFFPLALYWWGHIHQQRHTLIATERELTSHFLLISAGFNL